MAGVKEITSIEEWNQIKGHFSDRRVFVFKHSTTCPISAEAYREFNQYLNQSPCEDVEYTIVKVIESRLVSNQIAADLGVKHESPQAILIEKSVVKWHASHWKITNKTLQEQIGS